MYDDHSIFLSSTSWEKRIRDKSLRRPIGFSRYRQIYVWYTRQTKCKRAKQISKTLSEHAKNTHKHLLYLIHFAVHPLAAFLRQPRDRQKDSKKRSAAPHCAIHFLYEFEVTKEKSGTYLSNLHYSLILSSIMDINFHSLKTPLAKNAFNL